MSKIEINSQFDANYSEQLYDELSGMVKEFNGFFQNTKALAQRLSSHIDLLQKEKEWTTVLQQQQPCLKEMAGHVFRHRLKLINWVKAVIYFCEMRTMPFTVDGDASRKSTRLVSSIIDLLNTHLSGLYEINEYKVLDSVEIHPHRTGDESPLDLMERNRNSRLDKSYGLLHYIMRYNYVLHNLQKAIYAVRVIPDNYKSNIEEYTSNCMYR